MKEVIVRTELRIGADTRSSMQVKVDERVVTIPIPTAVKTAFTIQFVRPNPSKPQREKYQTIMQLVAAAYLRGLQDGGSQ